MRALAWPRRARRSRDRPLEVIGEPLPLGATALPPRAVDPERQACSVAGHGQRESGGRVVGGSSHRIVGANSTARRPRSLSSSPGGVQFTIRITLTRSRHAFHPPAARWPSRRLPPRSAGCHRRRCGHAALGRPRRHADHRSAFAEREPDQQHQLAGLRVPGHARQAVGDRPGAGRIVDAGQPHDLALQAAPGCQVPRRHAVHRRRRRVQLRACEARTRRSFARTPTPPARPTKIDDLTVEFTHPGPNPIDARTRRSRSTSCPRPGARRIAPTSRRTTRRRRT